ncbi:alanine dehydrogenase [Bacteroidota bacterium]
MIVATVKEIKRHEYRVGLTPSCVKAYVKNGHSVIVEKDAGVNAGFENEDYIAAGAEIMEDTKAIFAKADMIVKVKEPQPAEYPLFKKDQILYTYLHLAADKTLTKALMDAEIKGIAYETIEDSKGGLPCLKPMSEIAGRLATQEGAKYLERPFGGRGVLLGGVPGVPQGKVGIIGGGIVGTNALKMAVGLGADVTVLDLSSERLTYLDDIYGNKIQTLYSTENNIETVLKECDLIIGAVLIPGAKAPKLVKKEHLKLMKKGAVLVDVAVDQGGCFETTVPTTHDNPIYEVDGIIHYSVANMPGAVARTSTIALTSTTLKHGIKIANFGVEKACLDDENLKKGLNLYKGLCVYKEVAKDLELDYTNILEII